AAVRIRELFEQGASQSLCKTADDLALYQHRVDRLADIESDEIALDVYCTSFGIELELHDVCPVGINHVIRFELGLGSDGFRPGGGEIGEFHGGAWPPRAHDFISNDVEQVRGRLHHFGRSAQHGITQLDRRHARSLAAHDCHA